jgi:hypothetical protein
MTLRLAWKTCLVGIARLVCVGAAVSCGELRLPEVADATPGPGSPRADAAAGADAAPRGDGGPVIDAGPSVDGGPSIDAGLGCADVDLGSALGAPVFTGDTTGLSDDDLSPGCGGDVAGDIYLAWTAPATDRFLFDTCGSAFDTVLSAREGDCGLELKCSDDVEVAPCELQSRFTLDLTAGQRIILVVDGYGEEGAFVLNIGQL